MVSQQISHGILVNNELRNTLMFPEIIVSHPRTQSTRFNEISFKIASHWSSYANLFSVSFFSTLYNKVITHMIWCKHVCFTQNHEVFVIFFIINTVIKLCQVRYKFVCDLSYFNTTVCKHEWPKRKGSNLICYILHWIKRHSCLKIGWNNYPLFQCIEHLIIFKNTITYTLFNMKKTFDP